MLSLLEEGNLPNSDSSRPNVALSNGSYGFEGLFQHARRTVPRLRDVSDHRLGRVLRHWGATRTKLGPRRAWKFPSLDVLRKQWEEKYGFREWPSGADVQWELIGGES